MRQIFMSTNSSMSVETTTNLSRNHGVWTATDQTAKVGLVWLIPVSHHICYTVPTKYCQPYPFKQPINSMFWVYKHTWSCKKKGKEETEKERRAREAGPVFVPTRRWRHNACTSSLARAALPAMLKDNYILERNELLPTIGMSSDNCFLLVMTFVSTL